MTNGVNNEVYEEIIEESPPEYIAPPEYGDLYLKFADEASASEALEGYEGSVDIIGVIYNVERKVIVNNKCRLRYLLSTGVVGVDGRERFGVVDKHLIDASPKLATGRNKKVNGVKLSHCCSPVHLPWLTVP